jgi:hypothetical protein
MSNRELKVRLGVQTSVICNPGENLSFPWEKRGMDITTLGRDQSSMVT